MKIPTVVFVGTYPPRECGIATFTQDLLSSSKEYLGPGISCKVAAFNVSPLDKYIYPTEVEWEIDQNNKKKNIDLAKIINSDPLIIGVILQHEYGIYGGNEGENILYFMERCKKPMLVALHTVLPEPNIKMKEVTEKVIKRADVIVVLTQSSKKILEEVYPMAKGKVHVIPHGIHPTKFSTTKVARRKLKLEKFQILSTFGFLSREKGIEYVIKALPVVVKKNPSILYLILGKTHPAVHRNEGESYRIELTKLVKRLNLTKHVKFYDQYLDLKDLIRFLKATDIYISTSINPSKAVSGTLSYAMGTGRAVVSTEFAQAKEIITTETGRLVPIKNSKALSKALIELLEDKQKLKQMHKKAYEITRPMLWSNVAFEYSKLLLQSIVPPLNLDYLYKMTDKFGLFQFGSFSEPNMNLGYTIDDNARALIVSSWLFSGSKKRGVAGLIKIYLEFIKKCQCKDGGFVNYVGFKDKLPTIQNKLEDLNDANARALWALSEVMTNNAISKDIRNQAKNIFLRALPFVTKEREHMRAGAFIVKALVLARETLPQNRKEMDKIIKKYADKLVLEFDKFSSKKEWQWFESGLSYSNAVLPESLFMASKVLKDNLYLSVAKKSLQFLIKETFNDGYYLPIGNSRWYRNGDTRSEYDQQPEDPSSMILALTTAYETTRNKMYQNLANKCFKWFLGSNSLQKSLYDYKSGGCYDGLTSNEVNLNQGAESLVSYLLARLAITKTKLK